LDKIYKPSEFAKEIGVAYQTLWNWDKKGIFTAHKSPTGRRFYTEKQLKEYKDNIKDWYGSDYNDEFRR